MSGPFDALELNAGYIPTFHHFWKRWAREYLHTLQQKSKWTRKTTNLKEGDMVFILDSTLMRQRRWPLGIVTLVHPGADEFVRTATIRTASGIYDRPITKLALLSISQPHLSTERCRTSGVGRVYDHVVQKRDRRDVYAKHRAWRERSAALSPRSPRIGR